MCEKRTSAYRAFRARASILILLLLPFLLAMSAKEDLPEVDAAFFYKEICPSCENYQKAEELAGLLVRAKKRYSHVTAKSYNTALSANAEKFKVILAERGIPDISYLGTVLVVNGEYIVGYEEIEIVVKHLRETGIFIAPEGSEG